MQVEVVIGACIVTGLLRLHKVANIACVSIPATTIRGIFWIVAVGKAGLCTGGASYIGNTSKVAHVLLPGRHVVGSMLILSEDSNKPLVIQHRADFGPPGLDIRQHYYDADGEMLPTKKGVRIPDDELYAFLAVVLNVVLGWDNDMLKAVGDALAVAGWEDCASDLCRCVGSIDEV